jgi:hypothetical protein
VGVWCKCDVEMKSKAWELCGVGFIVIGVPWMVMWKLDSLPRQTPSCPRLPPPLSYPVICLQ